MAPAAARWAHPGSLSRSSFFLAPSPNAAKATVVTRLCWRTGGANRALVLAARSVPRDGEWDPSTGTGRMVDEDMATLRRRIREARAAMSEDDNADDDVPITASWTDLERRQRRRHAAGARGAAWLFEAFFVNAHPGHGAGVLALLLLLLLGVPASAFLVGAKLVQAVDAIASAVNGR